MLESKKPCSEIGPKLSYDKKLRKDMHLQTYLRAYGTHYAILSRGTMTRQEFNDWHEEAKNKLELVRASFINFEEYKKWLKK